MSKHLTPGVSTLMFPLMLALMLTSNSMPTSASETDFRQMMDNEESCFAGDWADEQSFLKMLISRNASLATDEPAKERAREYYRRMKNGHECFWFDYVVNGNVVRGFYAKPATSDTDRLPVVIFNRGGNADHGTFPSPFIFGKLFPIVDEGYVVIGSMYRGASLGGKPNPDRLKDEFGGDDVNDVLALLDIIDRMPFANAERIAIWGASRGGMMAYLTARRSTRLDTIIVEAAPVDLMAELKLRPEMEKVFREWIPDYEHNKENALRERSALFWIDELPDIPLLLLHGTADKRVDPNASLRMASRLQALGHPYQLVMFKDGDHSLHDYGQQTTNTVVDWLNAHLKSTSIAHPDSGH